MLDSLQAKRQLYPLAAFAATLGTLICGMLHAKSGWIFAFLGVLILLFCVFGLCRAVLSAVLGVGVFGCLIGGVACLVNRDTAVFLPDAARFAGAANDLQCRTRTSAAGMCDFYIADLTGQELGHFLLQRCYNRGCAAGAAFPQNAAARAGFLLRVGLRLYRNESSKTFDLPAFHRIFLMRIDFRCRIWYDTYRCC